MQKIIVTFLLLFLSLGLTSPVWAAADSTTGDFSFREQVKSSNPNKLFVGEPSEIATGQTDTETMNFIVNLTTTITGLLSILLLIHLLIGAYSYVTIGGDEMINTELHSKEAKIQKAKATIVQALVGFIIVILSYSIINVIITTVGQPNGFQYEEPREGE